MTAKQALLQAIESSGWHLNTESLDDLLQNEKANLTANDVIKKALNADLKEIGKKYIPEGVMLGKVDTLQGPCVVQIVKIKNVAAPKENEHSTSAPPFLKITLTDGGATNCNALVMENIQNLNVDTPPGTKLLLKGTIKARQSSLLLDNQSCEVLGGIVERIFSKWKTTKDLTNHVRTSNTTEGAAPAWVPFGTEQTNRVDTSKKTLKPTEVQEDSTSEFSQHRQAAVAGALQDKLKTNKTFIHQNVDKTVPNQNAPQENAPISRQSSAQSGQTKKGRFGRGNREGDEADYKEGQLSKPSTTTLFDFITKNTSKIQIKDDNDAQKQSTENTDNNNNNTTNTNINSTKTQTNNTNTNSINNNNNNTSNNSNSTNNSNINNGSNNNTNNINNMNSNGNNYYNRRNNRDNNYNDYNTKERKISNLPPRLQRANDERERYNNNNNNTNQRRSAGNNMGQDRPQKYNNNKYNDNSYNNQQTVAPAATNAAAAAAASAATTSSKPTNNYTNGTNTKNEVMNTSYESSNNTPPPPAAAVPAQQQQQQQSTNNYTNQTYVNTQYYKKSNKKFNNRSYNQNDNQNYYYQKQSYHNNNNNYTNNQVNANNTNNNINNQQQKIQQNAQNIPNTFYITPVSGVSVTAQAGTVTPTQAVAHINQGGAAYVPYGVIFDPSNPALASHHPQYQTAAAFYNGQIPAGAVYTQTPYATNPYDASNGAFYCTPTVLQTMIPISSAPQLATGTIPTQVVTSVASIPTHIVSPPQPTQPQQQQQQQEQYQSPQPTTQQPQPQPQQQQQFSDNNNNINNNQTDNLVNKNTTQAWKKGDHCLAIYYADKKYYQAIIRNIKTNTAHVEYIGYDDSDDVSLNDIKPLNKDNNFRGTTGTNGNVSMQTQSDQQQIDEINNNFTKKQQNGKMPEVPLLIENNNNNTKLAYQSQQQRNTKSFNGVNYNVKKKYRTFNNNFQMHQQELLTTTNEFNNE